MKMNLSFLTLLALLIFICVACVSSSSEDDAADVTQRDDDVSRNDDEFGMGRELTSLQKELRAGKRRFQQLLTNLRQQQSDEGVAAYNQTIQSYRNQTHVLRLSLSQQLRSLNSFMACVSSCTRAHSNVDHTALAGSIHYFCNHSCMMAFEQHTHDEVYSSLSFPSLQQTSTPDPGRVDIIG